MDHGVLERLEEVLLELEVRQLVLLEEPHRKLTERVERKEADVGVIVTADLQMRTGGGAESAPVALGAAKAARRED